VREVVLISGHLCTGKSGLARALQREFGYALVKTSEVLAPLDRQINREALRTFAAQLDQETQGEWVFKAVREFATSLPANSPIVVDNLQTRRQLEYFRGHAEFHVTHVHLYASAEELLRRYKKKCGSLTVMSQDVFAAADCIKDESDIEFFKRDADVRIYVGRTDTGDNLVRVAARLGLYPPPDVRCVDVIVGGQFGSEGKGHIAAYLARDYDILVRVGGPNAGHSVSSASGVYVYHQLPSGAKDTDARILLGPGMTLNVERLMREIQDCEIGPDRLFIDPQVMVIEKADLEQERELVTSIASTGRGGGAAAARRIMGRRPGAVRLARDIDALKPFVGEGPHHRGSIAVQLEEAYRQGLSVLLEGTQGSGLSLYHGQYPYVTSRDTNVAGCLAEAGISPSRVRRILMVIRPTPIRVGNPDAVLLQSAATAADDQQQPRHSGQLKHETTFEEVAKQAGLDPRDLLSHEKTSTTKRDRRVGWFDWEQFRKACALNAPSDIVLTFADYLSCENQNARRFEQLNMDTIKFIEEIERVAHAPVSLINTRFVRTVEERLDRRSVIDRRNWGTRKQANAVSLNARRRYDVPGD
jgi:adenylosuccinate synthase